MRIVHNLDELKDNIMTLENYLSNKIDPQYNFALDLVKKGICFVIINEN